MTRLSRGRFHEVHLILANVRPRQGDVDDPANWARYDLIWPHLGPSEAWNCDDLQTRQLLIDWVRYLWKRGDFDAALESAHKTEERWRRSSGRTTTRPFTCAFTSRTCSARRAASRPPTNWTPTRSASSSRCSARTIRIPCRPPGGLGGDLRGLGRFREALDLDEATYSRLKNLLPDEPTTLSSADNLAMDLRLVGDYTRARDLDQETLDYSVGVLSARSPVHLQSASMLARDMREAGDYAASAQLLKDTYERYPAVLGEDFIDTLRTAKSLAVSLRKMGRLDEAYALTTDTDDRCERIYERVTQTRSRAG